MASRNDIVWYLIEGFWSDFYNNPSAGRRKFDVQPGGTLTVNLTGLTGEGQGLAIIALSFWTEVTGIRFREVSHDNADILFWDHRDGAASYYLSINGSAADAAIVRGGIIDQSWVNVPAYHSIYYTLDEVLSTYIHEIGHALGLGHPGDYNGTEGLENVGTQFNLDVHLFTIMSYAHELENPETREAGLLETVPVTPMLYDIDAMWELYGEPPGGINAGNSTYYAGRDVPDVDLFQALNFRPANSVTIVDTGGRDTLYLGGTNDAVGFFTSDTGEKTIGMGNVNGAPVLSDGRFAINLVFHGEIENLYGGGGDDWLQGADADNRLDGGAGDDILEGGGGNDILTGGPGDDRLAGGPGADRFVFHPSDNPARYTDAILDFNPAEGDRIDLRAYKAITGVPDNWVDWFEHPPLLASSRSRMMDLDGDGLYDVVLYGWTDPLQADHFIFADPGARVTTVTGAATDDTLEGTDGNDRLAGLAGDDWLYGGAGDDVLEGGDGNDILTGGPGADALIGGPGNDTLSYLSSPAAVTVNLQNGTARGGDARGDTPGDDLENLWGSAYGDVLTGTDSRAAGNAIYGLGGDDVIDGGDGDDWLVGGPGADALIGGPGDDTAGYWNSPGGVTVRLHSLQASGGDAEGDTFPSVAGSLPDIENLNGSDHNDILAGDSRDNFLTGAAGDDRLYGGPGGGDDTLVGGPGDDWLYGGQGDDFMEGGPGRDRLYGGPGDDTAGYWNSPAGVTVRLHSLQVSGGDAQGDVWGDLVTVSYTRAGQVYRETVPDIIHLGGSNHNDTLAGDSRDNILYGWDGDDALYGGPGGGDDELLGHNGDDALYGGRGDDVLIGGPGADYMAGGPGADGFFIRMGETADAAGEFIDVIADFNPAEGDGIVLGGFDAAITPDSYWIPDGSADTHVDLDGDGWSDIILAGYTDPLLDQYFVFA